MKKIGGSDGNVEFEGKFILSMLTRSMKRTLSQFDSSGVHAMMKRRLLQSSSECIVWVDQKNEICKAGKDSFGNYQFSSQFNGSFPQKTVVSIGGISLSQYSMDMYVWNDTDALVPPTKSIDLFDLAEIVTEVYPSHFLRSNNFVLGKDYFSLSGVQIDSEKILGNNSTIFLVTSETLFRIFEMKMKCAIVNSPRNEANDETNHTLCDQMKKTSKCYIIRQCNIILKIVFIDIWM